MRIACRAEWEIGPVLKPAINRRTRASLERITLFEHVAHGNPLKWCHDVLLRPVNEGDPAHLLTLPRRPTPLSSFVGRERELDEAARLLARTRLLTITGTGGCGKTRLALRLADVVATRFPDGIALADLSRVGDGELVAPTVAAALGVEPRKNFADAVGEATALLVVDNCEHLIDATAEVIHSLLTSCPGVTVTATSREALGLEGEIAWRLPSLSLPATAPVYEVARIMQSDAVRLFCERAFEHNPNFALTPANAELVVAIVTRLDGIPLALELAASRVESLSLGEISDRLNDTFRLLTGGSRTSLARHQTLRAAIDWSIELLEPAERALFERLAVFAGTFDLAAAEVVVAGPRMPAAVVDDLLGRLVAKSLVVAEPSTHGGLRYRLLEMLRQYAQERFRHLPASAQRRLRRRHGDHYLAAAERAHLNTGGRDEWSRTANLAEEYDNLGAALDWSSDETGAGELHLRLVEVLIPLWHNRAMLAEEIRRLRFAVDMSGIPDLRRAAMLNALGAALRRSGRPTEAIALHEEGLALLSRAGGEENIPKALNQLGAAHGASGDHEAAGRAFHEALGRSRSLGLRRLTAESLNNLAYLALLRGRPMEARTFIDEALGLIGPDEQWLPYYLHTLAGIRAALGDAEGARTAFADVVVHAVERGDPTQAANGLEGLARSALKEGRPARALSLLAAAGRLRRETGVPTFDHSESETGRSELAARLALDLAVSAEAWERGQSTRFEDLPALAAEPAVSVRSAGGISHRERECAGLVAAGLSNKQIAARLGIGTRTVETHLENLRVKLGFRGRAQIAAWATDSGLRAATT